MGVLNEEKRARLESLAEGKVVTTPQGLQLAWNDEHTKADIRWDGKKVGELYKRGEGKDNPGFSATGSWEDEHGDDFETDVSDFVKTCRAFAKAFFAHRGIKTTKLEALAEASPRQPMPPTYPKTTPGGLRIVPGHGGFYVYADPESDEPTWKVKKTANGFTVVDADGFTGKHPDLKSLFKDLDDSAEMMARLESLAEGEADVDLGWAEIAARMLKRAKSSVSEGLDLCQDNKVSGARMGVLAILDVLNARKVRKFTDESSALRKVKIKATKLNDELDKSYPIVSGPREMDDKFAERAILVLEDFLAALDDLPFEV